jgi:hypothetical protein
MNRFRIIPTPRRNKRLDLDRDEFKMTAARQPPRHFVTFQGIYDNPTLNDESKVPAAPLKSFGSAPWEILP